MILINLLPHREERRQRRKQAFFIGLGLSAVAGFVVAGAWYLVIDRMTVTQQERNQFLNTEIAKLDDKIKDIATLRDEIDALKARQKAVEDLQTDRNVPVYLLNELVRQTPEGIYLTSIKQDGQTVTLTGVAQSNERVSEMLRNTAYNSPWLDHPELQEIAAATQQGGANGRDVQHLFNFSMKVSIKRPQDTQGPDGQASAPAAGASAAHPGKVALIPTSESANRS
jgi:type IV pilus assembly protein PilN